MDTANEAGHTSLTASTICRELGTGLPTRARSDTAQTQAEIGAYYADYAVICPAYKGLIPLPPTL